MSIAPQEQTPAPVCTAPEQFPAELKAYVDHELSAPHRAAVRRHLADCAACRTEVEEMERTTHLLRGAGAQDARTPLTTALRARLLDTMQTEAGDAPTAAKRPVPLWRARPFAVFGTAGSLIAAAGAAWLMIYTQASHPMGASGVAQTQKSVRADRWNGSSDAATPATAAAPAPVTLAAPAAPAPSMDTRSFKAPMGRAVGAIPEMAPPEAAQRRSEAEVADKFAGPVPQSNVTVNGTLSAATESQASGKAQDSVDLRNSRQPQAAPRLYLADMGKDLGRQVHREASLGVSVAKLEPASNKVEEITTAIGGYVASNNLNTSEDGYKSADLSLRVPVKEFDNVMRQVSGLGEVVSKSVSGEDITEQLSDANQAEAVLAQEVNSAAAKLKSERLSDRRTSQKEWELRQLKIQRAQNQARLGMLRKMGRLSTINVNISEKRPKPAPVQSGFLGDLSETNRSAMLAFQSAVRVPVVMLIWILAFSPIWAPLLIAYRVAARKNAAAGTVPGRTGSDTESAPAR